MPGFLALWPLALRRAASRWRLLLPLLVGSILAVALLSSTFIYGDAVRQLGLDRTVQNRQPHDLDIDLVSYYASTDRTSYATIKQEMELAIRRNVQWFVDSTSRAMKGSTLFVNRAASGEQTLDTSPEAVAGAAESKADPRRRAFFFFQSEFTEHAKLVTGELPAVLTVQSDERGRPTTSPEVPVAVLDETAQRQGLKVGDRLLAVPHWEDASPFTVARVVGILRRTDPGGRFWQTGIQDYVSKSQNDNFIPLYVPEETFIGGLGGLFPKMLSDYSWSLFVDATKIDVRNVGQAKFGLERLSGQLNSRLKSFTENTQLNTTLAEFQTKDLFGRIPLLIVVLLILAIVAYFLVMVGNVLVERHLAESALLRSRGAGGGQVLMLYLWEALAIVVIGFFVGPLAAAGATAVLGLTPAFSDLTNGSTLPVKLSTSAYGLALGGALLALGALLLPTLKATRLNPLRHRASLARPSDKSWFTRYYIDLFVSILAGLLYWELTQRGTVVTESFFGERNVDKALLAAPALFLLAAGLLVLRFFPLAMGALGWLASSLRRAWIVLGLWQMGRDPVPYTRPILLLMLAASVAMFAANFSGTVNRSYEHRALYRSGGDLLVQGVGLDRRGPSISFQERYAGLTGGRKSSPVFRSNASQAQRLFSSTEFKLLAVDPKSFDTVAWYRDDFSNSSLQSLMQKLSAAPAGPEGIALPAETERLGVWVRPATPRRDIVLRARVRDANGRYADYDLGRVQSAEWQFLETQVKGLTGPRVFEPKAPLSLVSLTMRQTGGQTLEAGALYLDDLQVRTTGSPQPSIIEPFDQAPVLALIKDEPGAAGDSFETSTSFVRTPGGVSGVFIWGPGSLGGTRGLLLGANATPGPLPVIGSRAALEKAGIDRGGALRLSIGGHVVNAVAVDTADYFPTMDPFGDGFLVTSLPALLERVNAPETFIDSQPNEIWLSTGLAGPERDRFVQSLKRDPSLTVIDRDELEAKFRSDPLIAAGWRGILSIAFGAVAFVTLLGFAVYSYVQAQQRRVQFALLRGMGLSLRGLAGVVILEQAVVIVIGLGLGSWMGYQLTSILMPFLGLTEEGSRVLPPFAAAINWPAIIATYATIAVVFLAATVSLVAFFSRSAIQQALRFGEA